MKLFSIGAFGFFVLGLLLFGFNWIMDGYFEPIVLMGFICFLVGIIVNFIAIAKKEEGRLKFVSLLSFFIVLFLITWFEPFQVIHIMTWLKNIS